MKATWRRQGNVAVPVGEEAEEALRAIQDGREFMATIKGARNPKQHRLFWALCQILADNDPIYDTREKAKKWLLFSCGYVDTWMDHTGRVHLETKSIAYESMDQATFNEFFKLAIEKVCERIGTQPDEIKKRVYEMVDPTPKGHVWR